ncbi:signal peptide peptidase SppA [Trichothermofontia sp.]
MRDFLKQTLATIVGLILFSSLVITGLGGLLLFLLVVTASRDAAPKVKAQTVLVFDLSLEVTDSPPPFDPASILNRVFLGEDKTQITLRSLTEAITQAATDDRIVALFLDGRAGTGLAGPASLQEIQAAIAQFQSSGKPVIAYGVNWSESAYFLAASADTVAINPVGSVELNGFAVENVFLTGALKKFGVGVQVIRVGQYKSAVESVLLTQSSPETIVQTQRWLGDLWQTTLTHIGKARQRSPQQLQAIANAGGLLTAEQAKAQGLVDRVLHEEDLLQELRQLSGEPEAEEAFRQIGVRSYADSLDASQRNDLDNRPRLAVVYAEGDIILGEDSEGQPTIGSDRLIRDLRSLRQDEDVKAIVLRINSPGGSAIAAELIQHEVALTQKVKPVIVPIGDMAASGGYGIAVPAGRIFAEPTTITGSIGVFGLHFNIQPLANRQGVTFDVIKTAPSAEGETLTRPLTSQELALRQAFANEIYDRFLTAVADGRKLPKAKVAEVAEGRVWSGMMAQKLGLVDELGTLGDAIAYAVEQAQLGNNWQLGEYPPRRNLEVRLLERWLRQATTLKLLPTLSVDDSLPLAPSASQPPGPLAREFQTLPNSLTWLYTHPDPLGIYARLPFTLRLK